VPPNWPSLASSTQYVGTFLHSRGWCEQRVAAFSDSFEIAFIILPMIAQKILALVVGADAALIWFGVMVCVNTQTMLTLMGIAARLGNACPAAALHPSYSLQSGFRSNANKKTGTLRAGVFVSATPPISSAHAGP
jgi:hypothetical protein